MSGARFAGLFIGLLVALTGVAGTFNDAANDNWAIVTVVGVGIGLLALAEPA